VLLVFNKSVLNWNFLSVTQLKPNGKQSTVNRALDGNTYPG
jgi:hypothetical protein